VNAAGDALIADAKSRRQVKMLMKAGFESVESRYVESCMRTTRVDIARK
jgi:hypothetical protein